MLGARCLHSRAVDPVMFAVWIGQFSDVGILPRMEMLPMHSCISCRFEPALELAQFQRDALQQGKSALLCRSEGLKVCSTATTMAACDGVAAPGTFKSMIANAATTKSGAVSPSAVDTGNKAATGSAASLALAAVTTVVLAAVLA
jgi:hypothetical protein